MARPIAPERRTVVVDLLREDIDPDTAATKLGISRKSLLALKRSYLRGKLPRISGTVSAPVDQPATISRDRWGIAHIEAASLVDACAALGYAMAQDRLWHLDHMRRLAHRRLAEILGPNFLPQDRLRRTIGLTAAAQKAAAAMPAEIAAILATMARGINTGMEAARDNLAVEFDLLDYAPEPWSPVV